MLVLILDISLGHGSKFIGFVALGLSHRVEKECGWHSQMIPSGGQCWFHPMCVALVQSVMFFLNLKGEFKRHRSLVLIGFSGFNWIPVSIGFAESESVNPTSQIRKSPNPESYSRINRGASVEVYVFNTELFIHRFWICCSPLNLQFIECVSCY